MTTADTQDPVPPFALETEERGGCSSPATCSPPLESPITVHCGDCLDVLPTLDADSFDAVVTDPPYSSGGRTQAAARNVVSKSDSREADEWFLGDNMGVDSYIRWMRQVARECLRVVIQGGHAYVFTDWRQFTNLVTAWESVGWSLRSVIVWDKAKGGAMGSFWRNNHEWACVFTKGQPNPPAHRSCFNTWTGAKPQSHEHPTEKPLGLMTYIIEAIPRKTNRLLEPFAGSGTTLEAGKLLGWGGVGIERNPTYAKACAAKLSQDVMALHTKAENAPHELRHSDGVKLRAVVGDKGDRR